MSDFTSKERRLIDHAWLALEYCAQARHTATIELADMLKYETGAKTAGRPRIWAKALMVEAYMEGRFGSSEDRRKWLYNALHVSRGIRYAYMLGCSNEFTTAMEDNSGLVRKCQVAVETLNGARQTKRVIQRVLSGRVG